jgi:hypothetical protein
VKSFSGGSDESPQVIDSLGDVVEPGFHLVDAGLKPGDAP